MPDRPVLLVDLDGTITDSLDGIAKSLRHALDTVGASWDDSRDIRSIAGPPMPDTLASLGLEGSELQRAMSAYRERYSDVGWLENAVYEGMDGLLTGLAGQGFRMAVATSKDQRAARRILDHFGLDEPFEFIGGADLRVGRSAKADVIAHSLASVGVDPVPEGDGGTDGVLMIGDREHDVAGAARYGIPTAIVRWGYGSPEEWADARWSPADTSELERIIHAW
ncbi:HAD family hydrolase [Dietzia sp. UCD-THP]|uniref:HAD family hydrolase n=1 Tax=Dietzia natronolimnaea TaxID=161920 RepID=A0A2A2WLQ1_9ACTN|nr:MULTISPECIES: HAD hydrolase-like protein [Dietzia]EYT64438.1 HAD family hydrolase [Dietzia sp. UCD-THP]PAY22122.1 HAD family hydrolase [Dietzia natronolimnaea]